MNGFTILDSLPPTKRARPNTRSRYDAAIDAALEHEGKWVRLDKHPSADQKKARTVGGAVWSAARTHRRRTGLRGSFSIRVREDGGRWFVYLRKNPMGEERA